MPLPSLCVSRGPSIAAAWAPVLPHRGPPAAADPLGVSCCTVLLQQQPGILHYHPALQLARSLCSSTHPPPHPHQHQQQQQQQQEQQEQQEEEKQQQQQQGVLYVVVMVYLWIDFVI
ncbi:uncharacterized protein EMH_0049150 [Eimeria mitis]|uniref:Uncharacterized protein n=1 Tax=Eimeria mitis TaxID=44415 RepID=U6K0T7_9EIME|nr:uncharacterized protein EMH_0049150 [Eimeria mitis]CDJ29373.1 hypothetical protein EMH_0049150 [Eimeria mitis]